MATAAQIKKRISENGDNLYFSYRDKEGDIESIYDPETDKEYTNLFFDGEMTTVHSVDDAMNTPFIDGMTLTQASELLEITECLDD